MSVPLGRTCLSCRKDNYLDQLLIASDYNHTTIVQLIKTLKYRFVEDIGTNLSFLIKKYVFWLSSQKNFSIIGDDPIIVPIPLHYRRLNWRGFNQAEILANSLADSLQRHTQNNLIKRVTTSKPQADIKEREERLKNATGNIFKIIDSTQIQHKTVIIVDDVCTTGATLNECARVLKESGAKKVIAFVIARG